MSKALLQIHPYVIGHFSELSHFLDKYHKRYANLVIDVIVSLHSNRRRILLHLLLVYVYTMKMERKRWFKSHLGRRINFSTFVTPFWKRIIKHVTYPLFVRISSHLWGTLIYPLKRVFIPSLDYKRLSWHKKTTWNGNAYPSLRIELDTSHPLYIW